MEGGRPLHPGDPGGAQEGGTSRTLCSPGLAGLRGVDARAGRVPVGRGPPDVDQTGILPGPGFDIPALSVAAQPADIDQALRVAAELFAFGPRRRGAEPPVPIERPSRDPDRTSPVELVVGLTGSDTGMDNGSTHAVLLRLTLPPGTGPCPVRETERTFCRVLEALWQHGGYPNPKALDLGRRSPRCGYIGPVRTRVLGGRSSWPRRSRTPLKMTVVDDHRGRTPRTDDAPGEDVRRHRGPSRGHRPVSGPSRRRGPYWMTVTSVRALATRIQP